MQINFWEFAILEIFLIRPFWKKIKKQFFYFIPMKISQSLVEILKITLVLSQKSHTPNISVPSVTFSWRFLTSNTLEQLLFKLEKKCLWLKAYVSKEVLNYHSLSLSLNADICINFYWLGWLRHASRKKMFQNSALRLRLVSSIF